MLAYILKSIAAGLLIGIADLLILNVENVYVSSFLFSIALLIIIDKGLNLYTGKIGKINNKEDLIKCIGIYVFNLVGIYIIRFIALYRFPELMILKESAALDGKSMLYLFAMSVITGMFMYAATSTEHKIITIFCVAAFLLMDGKHSIAVALFVPIWKHPIESLIFAFGNAVGALFLRIVSTMKEKSNK